MFKYLRTMNCNASAPETVLIEASASDVIQKGALYGTNSSGDIINSIGAGMPKYVALESKEANEAARNIRFIRTNPNMLFETTSNTPVEGLRNGMRGLADNGGAGAINFFCEGGDDLELIAHNYDENTSLVVVAIL